MMEDKTYDIMILKRLFPYVKGEMRKLFFLLLLSCSKVLIGVGTPYLLAYILDHLFSFKSDTFFFYLSLLGIGYFLSILFNRLVSVGMLEISEHVLFKLRTDLFSSIQKAENEKISTYQKGDLVTRFTSDIEQIGESLGEIFLEFISNLLLLFGSVFLMFHMHTSLSLLLLLTVPLFFLGALFIAIKCSKYEELKQKKLGEVTGYFEERTTGLALLKAYHIEEDCIKEFDEYNQALCIYQKKANFFSQCILPLNTLISNLGNLLVLFYGSFLIFKGEITIGILFAFLSYADMFRSPIHEIGSIFSDFSSSIAGLHRIFEVMDLQKMRDGKEEFKDFAFISFKEVFFAYDKNMVLKNVTFQIPKGKHIALVGPTGSGKTTLVQLLLGDRTPTKGSIHIGGIPLQQLKRESFYQKVSVLFQEPFLFNETILENVMYGNKGCSKKEAIEALKKVGADFVWKLEKKERYIVGREGKNLSEGEKQLVVIARAMLKDADILILDEATSNVDLFTEKKVYDAMQKLMKNKTVIMIAHRLKTILNADQIVYLEKGKIVEIGTHQSLLLRKGKYCSLYQSQIS